MWGYDEINASWWTRYWAGSSRRATDVRADIEAAPAAAGRAVGVFGREVVRGATEDDEPAVASQKEDTSGTRRPTEDEGWALVIGGVAAAAVLGAGAAIYFGTQDRKRAAAVEAAKTRKKLATMRRKLRG